MPKYITPKQLIESPDYPFTPGRVKWMLESRHKNGFDLCCRKIGRRIYINTELLNAWIEDHAEAGQQETA